MRVFGLFVTRNDNTEVPELVDAWDEWTIEENPEGYHRACRTWADESDVNAFAVVGFELPEVEIMNALYPDPVMVTASAVKRVEPPEAEAGPESAEGNTHG